MANLKIDDIVNVVVSTASAVAPRDGFNVGLILGKTVGTGMSAANYQHFSVISSYNL